MLIAFSEVGRQAIYADPYWNNGDYYDKEKKPDAGLAVARMEVQDAVGQRTTLSFSGWKRNPAFASGTFKYTPGKGVDVIGDL